MAIKGVDISEHNGSVDFAALAAAGVAFVIIRCGYGSDYAHQDDRLWEENVRKAEAAGMPWGAYLYSYAKNAAMGKSEAAHVLRLLAGRRPAYGVWLDMEDSSTLQGDLKGAAEAFCTDIEAAGLYVGVYANLNWFKNHLTDPVFDRWDRWCAQYNSVCQLQKPYGIWQYTSSLTIAGKRFDANWAYQDYPALTGAAPKAERTPASRVLLTQPNAVTRGFGSGHSGVDLGWMTTPTDGVLAHSEGTVVFCQTGHGNDTGAAGNASYGNCVKLQHPNGWYTLYAHLSAVEVAQGQRVERGQVIGRMGNTGCSYGNHLHFEVRDAADRCVDPVPYLAADLSDLPAKAEDTTGETEKTSMTYEQFKAFLAQYEKERAAQPVSGWAEPAVDFCQERKIMVGDGGAFRAGSTITRQEAAQVAKNLYETILDELAERIENG